MINAEHRIRRFRRRIRTREQQVQPGESTEIDDSALPPVLAPGTGMASRVTPELVLLDAVEASWMIRRREISCVELMRAHLEHIERFNPLIGALVSLVDPDLLLHNARCHDRALERGELLGWMHGFPLAVKDLADARGLPTSHGSPLRADHVADADSPTVARMRAAGAIVIGKTNVPEFGLGSHTFNSVFGTTLNPYDRTRTAGGSSGGAAAALAMRLVPVADGSDFMGSLRNPAAYCNVLGLRPGFGRVPQPGFVADPGVAGPMGRTVRDVAMLLSTMAGPDPRSPLSLDQDPACFTESLGTDHAGTRIGWLGDLDGHLAVEEGVLDQCRNTFPALDEIGCTIEPAHVPGGLTDAWETFLLWRQWMVGEKLDADHGAPEQYARLKPEARWEMDRYRAMSVRDIARAREGRDRWHATVCDLFERYDYLLAPSAQLFPFPAEQRWPSEIAGREMDTYHRWMETTAPWTLSGNPVLNLPAGFTAAGLPMGVQLIGRHRDELGLLRLGHAYEAATDWIQRILPPLLR